MSDVKRYWIPGPLTSYGTTSKGFAGEVLVVAATDYEERDRDRRDLAMQLKSYDLLRRAVNESTNECGPDCDDHGHADNCPAINPTSWLEDQQRTIDALAARLAEEQERLDFLQGFLFTRRWMPPIGSPFTWELVGHWRHQIKDLKGETFRGAIDAARAADSAGEKP